MPKRELKKFHPIMPHSQYNLLANSEQSLVYDIVDGLFDKHQPDTSVRTSKETISSSTNSVDQRLLYWKMMLQKRRAMQKKLKLSTGKQPEQLLINYPSSMEHRTKQTMKHLLDQAEKVDPITRTRIKTEIISIPQHLNLELMGTESPINNGKNKWLNSKILEERVEDQFTNIEKLIEYYPESNNLEVLGKRIYIKATGKWESLHSISGSSLKPSQNSDITISDYSNCTYSMSDATSLAGRSLRTRYIDEKLEVGLLINGMPYKPHIPEFSPNLERMFVCNPFENILRTVMRIENVGREAIRFSWMQADFFAYNATLFEMLDDEFIFDTSPFQLRSGEIREVSVLFRPRKVSTVKQRWLLKTRPSIFFRRPCALTLNIHGRCTATAEYTNLLMEYTLGYVKGLHRASLTHSLKKIPENVIGESVNIVDCPYQRPLEEREVFNQRNRGFNCATFDDMEVLKNFYQRIKPNQNYSEWDYSVRLLINLMCSHENKSKRIEFFKDFQNLLGRLRGGTKSLCLGDTEKRIMEREKTKYLYVRGLITNILEMLEEEILLLEKLFVKQRLQSRNMNQLEDIGEVLKLQNELRHSKHFHDSIYIYTYNTLCNLTEDIVSVIESTEFV